MNNPLYVVLGYAIALGIYFLLWRFDLSGLLVRHFWFGTPTWFNRCLDGIVGYLMDCLMSVGYLLRFLIPFVGLVHLFLIVVTSEMFGGSHVWNNPGYVVLAYGLATVLAYSLPTTHYILWRLGPVIGFDNDWFDNHIPWIAYYIAVTSLIFLIPFAGVVHLSFLMLNQGAFWSTVALSFVAGLVGPLLVHLIVLRFRSLGGEDPELLYIFLPSAYFACCLIGCIFLFIGFYFAGGAGV